MFLKEYYRYYRCTDVQIYNQIGSEFGINTIKALIHTVQLVMAWEIFPQHTFGPLVPTEYYINLLPEFCPSLHEQSKPVFWRLLPLVNAPRHKAQIISKLLVHCTQIASTVTRTGCSVATLWCYHVHNMLIWTKLSEESFQHLVESTVNHEELRPFWRQKGCECMFLQNVHKWPCTVVFNNTNKCIHIFWDAHFVPLSTESNTVQVCIVCAFCL